MKEFKFHEVLTAIWSLVTFGDGFINRTEPWAIRDVMERTRVVFELVVLLDNIAALLKPFLPAASEAITKSIRWDGTLNVKRGKILFPRLA
jgi:methionyl-tRNA synthetase